MNKLLILCLLGDPMLPAASCDRTGGFNVDTNELINFLSEKQYQCLVITDMSDFIPVEHSIINNNIDLYRVSVMNVDTNDQQSLFAKAEDIYNQINNILQKTGFKPELIHSYYWLSGYIASMIASNLSIPFVHSIVAFAIDKEKSKAECNYSAQLISERAFLHNAEYVFAISETEKKTALHEYNLREDRIIVVGRDIDKSYLYPARNELGIARKLDTTMKINFTNSKMTATDWWNNGAFTYVGRIKKEKGVHYIIQAWQRLHEQYNSLVPPLWIIGGDIEAIEKMRAILYDIIPNLLDYEKKLQLCWWGHLDSEAISGIYLKTLAFIAHSQYEAGGRVIIEAMSQKIPVIATPVGFASDLIHNWHNGFLVKYGDVEQLTIRMAHFVQQPILSNVLGNAAKRTIEHARQSWNYYEQIQNVYSKFFLNCQAAELNKNDEYDIVNTDFFSLGMISSYPYAYNRFFEKDGSYIELPYSTSFIEKTSLVHNAIISQKDLSDASYLQIRYFSELNKAKLWNYFADTEVHLGSIRYNKALSSSLSQVVVSSVEVMREELKIEIPLLPTLEDEDIFLKHEMMIELLHAFNHNNLIENNSFKPISYCSDNQLLMETMFNELLSQPVLPIWQTELIEFYENESSFIHEVISYAKDGINIFGINYGKSLLKRVVINKNKSFLLLPSTDIYYGEIGYDIGLYLYDTLRSNDEFSLQELLKLANHAACLYNNSSKHFLMWTLLVVFERFLSSNMLLLEDEIKENMKIWNALKQLICDQ